MAKYFEESFSIKGLENVDFKIKKMLPNEFLTLVMSAGSLLINNDMKVKKDINKEILSNIVFNKIGKDWFPILNTNGSARLTELDDNPNLLILLSTEFQNRIVKPAFLE